MAEATAIAEVHPSTESQFAYQEIPKQEPRFEEYFKSYPSKMGYASTEALQLFSLWSKDNKFLYQNKNNGELKHVIWDNLKEVERNRYEHQPWWIDLTSMPEILSGVNHILLEILEEANSFYPWGSHVKGFVITGKSHFGMNPGHGEGMNVSYEELKHLIKALKDRNQEKISAEKAHLVAEMVHELTHNEKDLIGDEGISFGTGAEEIGPHIPQFLFDPKNNHIFNRQLKRAFGELKSRRDQGESKQTFGYDWAQYIALLVTADKLSEENQEIKEALEKDSDPSKIEGLKKVIDLAGSIPEKRRKEIASQFMEVTNAQIIERAKAIEDRLGITYKLV